MGGVWVVSMCVLAHTLFYFCLGCIPCRPPSQQQPLHPLLKSLLALGSWSFSSQIFIMSDLILAKHTIVNNIFNRELFTCSGGSWPPGRWIMEDVLGTLKQQVRVENKLWLDFSGLCILDTARVLGSSFWRRLHISLFIITSYGVL